MTGMQRDAVVQQWEKQSGRCTQRPYYMEKGTLNV